jgi:hypothetical protein
MPRGPVFGVPRLWLRAFCASHPPYVARCPFPSLSGIVRVICSRRRKVSARHDVGEAERFVAKLPPIAGVADIDVEALEKSAIAHGSVLYPRYPLAPAYPFVPLVLPPVSTLSTPSPEVS